MPDIWVYLIPLPAGVDEVVLPCLGGYTIYLSDQLGAAGRSRAYRHALAHIRRGDCENEMLAADQIEMEVHDGDGTKER